MREHLVSSCLWSGTILKTKRQLSLTEFGILKRIYLLRPTKLQKLSQS